MPVPDASYLVIRCAACGKKLRVPKSALDRKAKCPECGQKFVVGAAGVKRPRRDSASDESIVVRCEKCAARLKTPRSEKARRVRCPRCSHVQRVGSAPIERPDDGLIPLADPEPTSVQAPAASVPQESGPMCPSCGRTLEVGAKICVQCGILVASGRAILTTQDENLNAIHSGAMAFIRMASWFVPLGIFPIASEGFGTSKPYCIRTIVLITFVCSIAYFPFILRDRPGSNPLQNLMLWGGSADAGRRMLAELENADAADRASTQLREHLRHAGAFHPYQLLTHALLHADLFHLLGNMVFLIVLGSAVNRLIGNLWTALLYPLFAIIAGGAEMISGADGIPYPLLGASGAVMGLAGAYAVLFPAHPVHMAAWIRLFLFWFRYGTYVWRGIWVVLFYIAFDVIYTVFGIEDGVAHWAHLGGFLAGVLVALFLLITRRINARGGDLLSVMLGRRAWALIGRPSRA